MNNEYFVEFSKSFSANYSPYIEVTYNRRTFQLLDCPSDIAPLQLPNGTKDSLFEVHQIRRNFTRDCEIDHPIDHMETDKKDGKDHPAVLVNVASSHS